MSWPGEELSGQRLELGTTCTLRFKPSQMQNISFLKSQLKRERYIIKRKQQHGVKQ